MVNQKKPQDLYELLRKYVIGQDDYLKKIATTVWLHNQRIEAHQNLIRKTNLQKHNLLCVGPTGSGKTLAISILAELYGLDLLVADASAITGSGWKGMDPEDSIFDLYHECGNDKDRTERGIVVLDEVDKMVLQRDADHPSFGAENSLLKIIEGTKVSKGSETIDTTNILFICSGAFEGVEFYTKKRINAGQLGFRSEAKHFVTDPTEISASINRADLRAYGAGAQFLGRFADIAYLRQLDAGDMSRILMESEASIVRSLDRTLRNSCGVAVTIDQDGADAVAKEAIREGSGARGLSQIISPAINDALFNLDPGIRELRITVDEKDRPSISLIGGERIKIKRAPESSKMAFPAPEESKVEKYALRLLRSLYDENTASYDDFLAAHALLCAIVHYVLVSCPESDHNIKSIQKLLEHAEPEFREYKRSVFEICMLCDDRKQLPVPAYRRKYKRFKHFDPSYRVVELLRQTIDEAVKNGAV